MLKPYPATSSVFSCPLSVLEEIFAYFAEVGFGERMLVCGFESSRKRLKGKFVQCCGIFCHGGLGLPASSSGFCLT